jgi:hypothetical protein
MVGNKRRVEGCIVEESKYKEIASFVGLYLAEIAPEKSNITTILVATAS